MRSHRLLTLPLTGRFEDWSGVPHRFDSAVVRKLPIDYHCFAVGRRDRCSSRLGSKLVCSTGLRCAALLMCGASLQLRSPRPSGSGLGGRPSDHFCQLGCGGTLASSGDAQIVFDRS